MASVCKVICILTVVALFAFLLMRLGRQRSWEFVAYGRGTDIGKTVCCGSYGSGTVTIENSGSGKMVPYAADGLSFYYTSLDARKDNFVLSATVTVDSWTMTNGEDDGFGLMVCDATGEHGDSADFWNNSYMAAVTKTEYEWNPETKAVSNIGSHIVMRQGIVAREKIGSTEVHPKDVAKAAHGQAVTTCTLENSQGERGEGTYNIIGNFTPVRAAEGSEHAPTGTVAKEALLTDIRLEIERDNTGYRLRYVEEDGTVHEKLFYDTHRENLSAIDPMYVYVGFFVTRQARVSFQNMNLTVTDAKRDPQAEIRLPEVLEPDFRVTSSNTSNSEKYDLIFETNYGGKLTLLDEEGRTLAGGVKINAGEGRKFPCLLRIGRNRYKIIFEPDTGENEDRVLSDPSEASFWHEVVWQKIGDKDGNIYTSPEVSSGENGLAKGTKDNPISLAEAVKYAAPGQRVLLAGGEYKFSKPLTIEQGHDGTSNEPVFLISDPENTKRPILNFQKKSAGIVLSADNWHLEGFDCTGSAANEYGVHLTGSHNTLECLEVYRNGNTGLHISSRSLWDDVSEWPSDNLILNCISYGNCDDAGEDADGFACQYTAGAGNVFDGCVAHHNADDGWDLYAKVWLESIGPVTVKNCTAYQNGYLEDGTESGDGNGFKLGGDNMPGGHIVENCLAFQNKNDGFTSNGCPDITLRDCIAMDNGKRNISLYTEQENSSYKVENTCSFGTEAAPKEKDNVKSCGTQKRQDIYNESVYYWDPQAQVAVNSSGEYLKRGNYENCIRYILPEERWSRERSSGVCKRIS